MIPIRTELRFASSAEWPALMSLINRAFAVERFFKDCDRLNERQIREYVERGRFVVAEQDGQLAGCVFVEVKNDRAYFGLLSVDPSVQKTGLGARLVAAAEEYARELGALHMDITIVNVREELPGYYEKLGYRACGTEPFPPEQMPSMPCHFIKMTKPLGKARE
jgi:N-acetylglutamate synthase-like GNAT family acetyltransferase